MTHEQLALESFVFWLIHAKPEKKYEFRYKICESVKTFGKQAVLDELEKQGKDVNNMPEATIMTRTIREIE